jgi:hypothetical protein
MISGPPTPPHQSDRTRRRPPSLRLPRCGGSK